IECAFEVQTLDSSRISAALARLSVKNLNFNAKIFKKTYAQMLYVDAQCAPHTCYSQSKI
ncbi:hypothetical protein C7B67_29835, partial [filamentous cyanobacterium Phorm 6]